MPPDSTEVTTTTEAVIISVPDPAWTSSDVDSITYIGAGGVFLTVMLLVATFVRSGS